MLRNLTREIEECREHAEQCARQAQTAPKDDLRENFLRLEKSWRQLARSYEFAQALLTEGNDEKAQRSRLY